MPKKPRKPTLAKAIAQRIVAAREAKGWTQAQLAEAAGKQQTWLCRIERGETVPQLRNILDIAAALNLDPSELTKPC